MKPLTGPQAVALRNVEAAERFAKAPGVAPPSAYVELEALGLIEPASGHERGAFRMTDAGREVLATDRPPVSLEDRGRTWYFTGKTGADRKTGERCAEYATHRDDGSETGERLWADFAGIVVERYA